jgi:hypothetical protein
VKYQKVTITWENHQAATKWARETFGQSRPPGSSFGNMLWYKKDDVDWVQSVGRRNFYFRDHSHATLFKLMWGGR